MNNKFDEFTKSLAQSVTRRGALKKFSVGLAGMALACFGLANRAQAIGRPCSTNSDCPKGQECAYGICRTKHLPSPWPRSKSDQSKTCDATRPQQKGNSV